MNSVLKTAINFFVPLFLLIITPVGARARPLHTEAPAGFTLISSAPGVELYRKDYPGGSPDFVQVVNLNAGAQVKLLHGEISEYRAGQGVYGGDDPRFLSNRLKHYWNSVSSQYTGTFCVSNGQFFFMPEYPTRLPFPLKVDGTIVSDGYGINDHEGEKLMLELWSDRADIRELTKEALYSSSAPNIVAGLTEDGRKSPTKYVPRTFMGIDDRSGDGNFDTVLVFNTKSARQRDAAQVLRDFGADKVMMLDGGGSTQLICQGSGYVDSERLIPQAIAVIAGDGTTKSAEVVQQVDFVLPEESVKQSANDNNAGSVLFNFDDGVQKALQYPATAGINIGDSVWILLFVIPVALVMVIGVSRIQRYEYY